MIGMHFVTAIFAFLWNVQTTVNPPAPGVPQAIIETRVQSIDDREQNVVFAIGSQAGIGVEDPFWLLRDGHIVASGRMLLTTAEQSVGKIMGRPADMKADMAAAIARRRDVRALSAYLPEGVSLRGELDRLPPGRQTGWVELGLDAGLKPDSALLVRREGIPIARGRVAMIEERLCLLTLQPLVANALSQAGDRVELWPEPASTRTGKINTSVLAVQPETEGALITIVGTARDGFEPDRLVDLYREDHYLGVASIVQTSDPLSVARVIESASSQTPQVGDLAVVRPSPANANHQLAAAVFRVADKDYCLIAAGESDGVRVGETLVVRRPNPDHPLQLDKIADLEVTTVKEQHCGARIHYPADRKGEVATWDFAERPAAPSPRWADIGTIGNADTAMRTAVADVRPETRITVGDILRWTRNSPAAGKPVDHFERHGAALVIHRHQNRVVLHVPIGWGDLHHLDNVRLEMRLP